MQKRRPSVRPTSSWAASAARIPHQPVRTASSASEPTTIWLNRGARESITCRSRYGSAIRTPVTSRNVAASARPPTSDAADSRLARRSSLGTKLAQCRALFATRISSGWWDGVPRRKAAKSGAPRAVPDYVIVGAGSAGCVLAARLSEDPSVSVLLLEAGGEDRKREIRIPAAFSKLYRTDVDWSYATVPQERLAGRQIYVPRGKVLGGSSSINAQMVIRGHRADYDGWAANGVDGWSWQDVLPYFERSTADGGGPFEIAEHRDRNRLTEALVEAARETGVGYRSPGGEEEARARREVILCGGAFNTPQLLLLSGIGPREHLAEHGIELAHELPGVGRNLQDHLAAGVLAATTTGGTLYAAESPRSIARYLL